MEQDSILAGVVMAVQVHCHFKPTSAVIVTVQLYLEFARERRFYLLLSLSSESCEASATTEFNLDSVKCFLFALDALKL